MPPTTPPIPPDEPKRLEALHRYRVLDSPPEKAFDDLALLASHICGVRSCIRKMLRKGMRPPPWPRQAWNADATKSACARSELPRSVDDG